MCIRLFSVLMLIVNKSNSSNMRNFLPNFIRILIKSIFINFCIMEIMLSLSTTTSSTSQPTARHASSSYRNFMLIDAVKLSSASSSSSSSSSSRSNFGFHKREADYTLDDSFWNEESPVGEVERLLKEYRQNQELVRRIGSHYYQIIYPVQLRHHEKMGISTREVNPPKYPNRGYDGNYPSGGGRGRSRTGKHFHRTSLLIKAFNHKFRLDLELNTQLLAPNIKQHHILPNGYSQDSFRDIEHCYYHGTVKDYPGASAAFHTCNGVSGVIHVGNETFVIHPFYGGDLSKHPHVIFEARTKANKGCANSGHMAWGGRRKQHLSGLVVDRQDLNGAGRYKRDVREATKYIETAIIIDKAMFDKRNGSTRAEVVHDAIQVANIADLYFRTLNTRVSVVYIETWQTNKAQIDGGKDISKAISNFNDYTSRNLFQIDKDTTQLLTGETFSGGEAGMSVPETVCTSKAVGISVDINTYEPHLLAGTMAHMIGHNIGMGHDDNREECHCRDWHGCIMAQSIVGLENVQPYKFSECSRNDYIDALRIGHGLCLLNKPNEVELEIHRNCGNGILEDGEDCDCGSLEDCEKNDPCCDGITCKLRSEAQCASGPCCEGCQLKAAGVLCRDANNECDLPEYCMGDNGQCPMDVYKKNGNPCGLNQTSQQTTGYCFNGLCPTIASQCEKIWGYGGTGAEKQCFEQFNDKGTNSGHCGLDKEGNYVKCESENVMCGSLQCKEGDRQPVTDGSQSFYSRTIINIKGIEYECKTTSGTGQSNIFPPHGLVHDGTPCGDNLVCVNQSCVSIFPHTDQTKCPTNHGALECSGHGVCTNINRCFCNFGWGGPDCSMIQATTTVLPTAPYPTPNNTIVMEKKETAYENYHGSNTVFLVGVLMSVCGGVFIAFALMALCYRSEVIQRKFFSMCIRRKSSRLKYDPPYVKKPIAKYVNNATGNHQSIEEISLDGSHKLIFGNQVHYRDPKTQPRRMTSASEEDPTHSGEEETVSFIDLPQNHIAKLPEKGILKKHGFGLMLGDNSNNTDNNKWPDDTNCDSLELIAQQDSNIPSGVTTAVSDVERTLKNMNGYHEDILEALRTAAQQSSRNTPSGSISEEMLRKTLLDNASAQLGYSNEHMPKRSGSKTGSKENICDSVPALILSDPSTATLLRQQHHHQQQVQLHHQQQQQQQQQMQVQPPPHYPPQMQQPQLVPDDGQLRIRNLEDLIRQLEHHSSRHMSPNGSEDIRMSETDPDRNYRVDSSAACSESSHGSNQQLAQSQKTATILPSYSSRCRPRTEEESRFVYGRYRQPTTSNRHPPLQSHSPHSFGHHTHHTHGHGHGHSSHHSSHTHLHQDEEGIYESADPHERTVIDSRNTPDSESDEFIQAQQQLARWASEDVVSVVVMESGQHPQQQQPQDSIVGGVSITSQSHQPQSLQLVPPHLHTLSSHIGGQAPTIRTDENGVGVAPMMNGTGGLTVNTVLQQRDYYPSPPSTTETESSSSVVVPQRIIRGLGIDIQGGLTASASGQPKTENTGRYPEYKH